jgi:hypothetical protein
MSKGYGKVQRKILAHLAQEPLALYNTIDIAGHVYGTNLVTDAECVAVRRALWPLAKGRAIARIGRGFRDRRCRWSTNEGSDAYHAHIARVFGKGDRA